MEIDRERQLCLSCRDLDLDILFKDVVDKESTNAGLHHDLEATCSLCTFFLSAVAEHDRPKTTAVTLVREKVTRPADRKQLYATSWATKTALTVHAVDAASTKTNAENVRIEYSKVPNEPLKLDPAKVDYEPLRFWCRNIQRAQNDLMDDLQQLKGPASEEDVLPRRVIDCHDRKIVAVQAPCDYFTLSYVWGPTATQDPSPTGDTLPAHLPKTVEDAMTVVREVGFRYLWVDRYCLDQTNKAEFQAQLNQMADIYRHGFACIIGAAGEDADYGLPGISTRARTSRPVVKLGDYTLWQSVPYQSKLVSASKWATRAWTYQEGVFASDWFAFTDEQVYFRRANRGMVNQQRWWKDSCETSPNGTEYGCAIGGMGIMFDSVYNNEGYIHGQLSEYTRRSMSFQSDAVNAMLGILKRCGNGPYPMSHYFGVPILGPLVSHRRSMARDPSRKWSLTEAFLVNLCWNSEDTRSRRTEFPSWSWAGWQAIYKQPNFSFCHLGMFQGSDFTVGLSVKMNGQLVKWEIMCLARSWDVYADLSQLPRELYIKSSTIPLSISRDPRDKDTSWAPSDTHNHVSSIATAGFCAIFSDHECDVLVELDLVDADVDSKITDEGTVKLKGVLLRGEKMGENAERRHPVRLVALAVREDGATSTRVGTFELKANNYLVRWRADVSHHSVEKRSLSVKGQMVNVTNCLECEKRATQVIMADRKDEEITVA